MARFIAGSLWQECRWLLCLAFQPARHPATWVGVGLSVARTRGHREANARHDNALRQRPTNNNPRGLASESGHAAKHAWHSFNLQPECGLDMWSGFSRRLLGNLENWVWGLVGVWGFFLKDKLFFY